MTPADHVRALASYAPDLTLDVVLADPVSLHADRGARTGAGRSTTPC